ncbi:MAG: hypothetical protein LBS79_01350 [Tannerella sp.]|nr:hypothetical protein [Tannerella sp.]
MNRNIHYYGRMPGYNFDDIRFHRTIFRPGSSYMASSTFFLTSSGEISSLSGTGKGVLSKSSTIRATRGCFVSCHDSLYYEYIEKYK